MAVEGSNCTCWHFFSFVNFPQGLKTMFSYTQVNATRQRGNTEAAGVHIKSCWRRYLVRTAYPRPRWCRGAAAAGTITVAWLMHTHLCQDCPAGSPIQTGRELPQRIEGEMMSLLSIVFLSQYFTPTTFWSPVLLTRNLTLYICF